MRPVKQLSAALYNASVWKTIGLISIIFNLVQLGSNTFLALKLSDKSSVEYLIPGIPGEITPVRVGAMPSSYIELAFKHAISFANAWTYHSIEDNYKHLFDNFYSKELEERTKANFIAEHYIDEIKSKKAVSIWDYSPADSEFHWCGKVNVLRSQRGVGCGIVTGTQHFYTHNNNPVSSRKISYLVFGLNVAPNPNTPGKNMFAVEIFRIKQGQLSILRQELEDARKNGVLPPDGGGPNV